MSIETGNGETQKVFEHFPKMPQGMKLIIVKEMLLRDRFTFARCSKSSWDFWAKITRNEQCLISVCAHGSEIKLEIQHGENEGSQGFILVFESVPDGKKYIRYKINHSNELWNIEVDQSFDIIQIGVNHVKKALEFYQNGIKKLHIDSFIDRMWLNLNNVIEDFKNLEELEVNIGADNLQSLLSKIGHPLKKLSAWHINQENTTLENRDQIYRVQEKLFWTLNDFNYPEFLQLSAKHVRINIGKLTEQDIFNFIKSWENGKYKGRMKKCTWDIQESKFDKRLLVKLFGTDYSRFLRTGIGFTQEGSGKNATLLVRPGTLFFMIDGI